MKTWFRNTFIAILATIAAWFGWNLLAVNNGLSWVLPTTYTNGSPLNPADLIAARIYRNVNSGAYAVYQTIPLASTFEDTNVSDGTYCYKVSVVHVNGIESAQSNEACKVVDTRAPSAPTSLTIN